MNNSYSYIEDYKNADIVIVNTCSVTNTADNKCKKAIRGVRRDNPDTVLVVCGCTAENHREELNNLEYEKVMDNVYHIELRDSVNFVKLNSLRNSL